MHCTIDNDSLVTEKHCWYSHVSISLSRIISNVCAVVGEIQLANKFSCCKFVVYALVSLIFSLLSRFSSYLVCRLWIIVVDSAYCHSTKQCLASIYIEPIYIVWIRIICAKWMLDSISKYANYKHVKYTYGGKTSRS